MSDSKKQRTGDATAMVEDAPAPRPAPVANAGVQEFSPELLRMYYDRVFPVQNMCRWLSYGTMEGEAAAQNLLHRREFSFTTGDDVYIRYLSYDNPAGFKKDLISKLPYKIDIGAIFSAQPRDHKKYKLFEPKQREFIIDIDLTDYDFLDCDVKRLETCDRCWPVMALAVRVLRRALIEDFGFEQLLFVYSGRRGMHCWVCDSRARAMSNEVRSAVAEYLNPKLNAATGRLTVGRDLHPSMQKALEQELNPFFKASILAPEADGGFGMTDTPERREKMLGLLGDESLQAKVAAKWERHTEWTGMQRWEHLVKEIQSAFKMNPKKSDQLINEIIFTYTYPRLDINVSKGMNHLLKSPWCAHPKTGRVCVPVDADKPEQFDPSAVPTLRMVAEDLDAAMATSDGAPPTTRLTEAEGVFDAFLKKLENQIRGEKAREAKKRSEEALEF